MFHISLRDQMGPLPLAAVTVAIAGLQGSPDGFCWS